MALDKIVRLKDYAIGVAEFERRVLDRRYSDDQERVEGGDEAGEFGHGAGASYQHADLSKLGFHQGPKLSEASHYHAAYAKLTDAQKEVYNKYRTDFHAKHSEALQMSKVEEHQRVAYKQLREMHPDLNHHRAMLITGYGKRTLADVKQRLAQYHAARVAGANHEEARALLGNEKYHSLIGPSPEPGDHQLALNHEAAVAKLTEPQKAEYQHMVNSGMNPLEAREVAAKEKTGTAPPPAGPKPEAAPKPEAEKPPPTPVVPQPKPIVAAPPPPPMALYPNHPSSLAALKNLTPIPGPSGSQSGQWYRAANGTEFYVKDAQSPAHAGNEVGTMRVYNALGAKAGVDVPRTSMFKGEDGKTYIVSEKQEGLSSKSGSWWSSHSEAQASARQFFGADVLLSHWDVFGAKADNLLVTSGGKAFRVETGGAGQYRAMGDLKGGAFQVGGKWTEPWTMRGINHDGATASNQTQPVYGGMTSQEAGERLQAAADRYVAQGGKAGLIAAMRDAGVPKAQAADIAAVVDDRVGRIPEVQHAMGYVATGAKPPAAEPIPAPVVVAAAIEPVAAPAPDAGHEYPYTNTASSEPTFSYSATVADYGAPPAPEGLTGNMLSQYNGLSDEQKWAYVSAYNDTGLHNMFSGLGKVGAAAAARIGGFDPAARDAYYMARETFKDMNHGVACQFIYKSPEQMAGIVEAHENGVSWDKALATVKDNGPMLSSNPATQQDLGASKAPGYALSPAELSHALIGALPNAQIDAVVAGYANYSAAEQTAYSGGVIAQSDAVGRLVAVQSLDSTQQAVYLTAVKLGSTHADALSQAQSTPPGHVELAGHALTTGTAQGVHTDMVKGGLSAPYALSAAMAVDELTPGQQAAYEGAYLAQINAAFVPGPGGQDLPPLVYADAHQAGMQAALETPTTDAEHAAQVDAALKVEPYELTGQITGEYKPWTEADVKLTLWDASVDTDKATGMAAEYTKWSDAAKATLMIVAHTDGIEAGYRAGSIMNKTPEAEQPVALQQLAAGSTPMEAEAEEEPGAVYANAGDSAGTEAPGEPPGIGVIASMYNSTTGLGGATTDAFGQDYGKLSNAGKLAYLADLQKLGPEGLQAMSVNEALAFHLDLMGKYKGLSDVAAAGMSPTQALSAINGSPELLSGIDMVKYAENGAMLLHQDALTVGKQYMTHTDAGKAAYMLEAARLLNSGGGTPGNPVTIFNLAESAATAVDKLSEAQQGVYFTALAAGGTNQGVGHLDALFEAQQAAGEDAAPGGGRPMTAALTTAGFAHLPTSSEIQLMNPGMAGQPLALAAYDKMSGAGKAAFALTMQGYLSFPGHVSAGDIQGYVDHATEVAGKVEGLSAVQQGAFFSSVANGNSTHGALDDALDEGGLKPLVMNMGSIVPSEFDKLTAAGINAYNEAVAHGQSPTDAYFNVAGEHPIFTMGAAPEPAAANLPGGAPKPEAVANTYSGLVQGLGTGAAAMYASQYANLPPAGQIAYAADIQKLGQAALSAMTPAQAAAYHDTLVAKYSGGVNASAELANPGMGAGLYLPSGEMHLDEGQMKGPSGKANVDPAVAAAVKDLTPLQQAAWYQARFKTGAYTASGLPMMTGREALDWAHMTGAQREAYVASRQQGDGHYLARAHATGLAMHDYTHAVNPKLINGVINKSLGVLPGLAGFTQEQKNAYATMAGGMMHSPHSEALGPKVFLGAKQAYEVAQLDPHMRDVYYAARQGGQSHEAAMDMSTGTVVGAGQPEGAPKPTGETVLAGPHNYETPLSSADPNQQLMMAAYNALPASEKAEADDLAKTENSQQQWAYLAARSGAGPMNGVKLGHDLAMQYAQLDAASRPGWVAKVTGAQLVSATPIVSGKPGVAPSVTMGPHAYQASGAGSVYDSGKSSALWEALPSKEMAQVNALGEQTEERAAYWAARTGFGAMKGITLGHAAALEYAKTGMLGRAEFVENYIKQGGAYGTAAPTGPNSGASPAPASHEYVGAVKNSISGEALDIQQTLPAAEKADVGGLGTIEQKWAYYAARGGLGPMGGVKLDHEAAMYYAAIKPEQRGPWVKAYIEGGGVHTMAGAPVGGTGVTPAGTPSEPNYTPMPAAVGQALFSGQASVGAIGAGKAYLDYQGLSPQDRTLYNAQFQMDREAGMNNDQAHDHAIGVIRGTATGGSTHNYSTLKADPAAMAAAVADLDPKAAGIFAGLKPEQKLAYLAARTNQGPHAMTGVGKLTHTMAVGVARLSPSQREHYYQLRSQGLNHQAAKAQAENTKAAPIAAQAGSPKEALIQMLEAKAMADANGGIPRADTGPKYLPTPGKVGELTVPLEAVTPMAPGGGGKPDSPNYMGDNPETGKPYMSEGEKLQRAMLAADQQAKYDESMKAGWGHIRSMIRGINLTAAGMLPVVTAVEKLTPEQQSRYFAARLGTTWGHDGSLLYATTGHGPTEQQVAGGNKYQASVQVTAAPWDHEGRSAQLEAKFGTWSKQAAGNYKSMAQGLLPAGLYAHLFAYTGGGYGNTAHGQALNKAESKAAFKVLQEMTEWDMRHRFPDRINANGTMRVDRWNDNDQNLKQMTTAGLTLHAMSTSVGNKNPCGNPINLHYDIPIDQILASCYVLTYNCGEGEMEVTVGADAPITNVKITSSNKYGSASLPVPVGVMQFPADGGGKFFLVEFKYSDDFHGNQWTGGLGGAWRAASNAYRQAIGKVGSPKPPALHLALQHSDQHSPAPRLSTPFHNPAHVAMVDKALREAKSTADLHDHTPNLFGAYTPERTAEQQALIHDVMSRAASVPNEGKAIMMAGLGGAGKDSTLARMGGELYGVKFDENGRPTNYLMLNPDDVKQEMIDRGMAPVPQGLTPMEAVALTHEESTMIAKDIAEQAMAMGKNVIWNITANQPGQLESRINALDQHDYNRIDGLMVDVPVQTAIDRMVGRYESGGRYVPVNKLTNQVPPAGSPFNSTNGYHFDQASHLMDSAHVVDNSGPIPVLVQ